MVAGEVEILLLLVMCRIPRAEEERTWQELVHSRAQREIILTIVRLEPFGLKGAPEGGRYPYSMAGSLDCGEGSFRNNCFLVVVFGRSRFNFTSWSHATCVLDALSMA